VLSYACSIPCEALLAGRSVGIFSDHAQSRVRAEEKMTRSAQVAFSTCGQFPHSLTSMLTECVSDRLCVGANTSLALFTNGPVAKSPNLSPSITALVASSMTISRTRVPYAQFFALPHFLFVW
jgi:hypothetical protein